MGSGKQKFGQGHGKSSPPAPTEWYVQTSKNLAGPFTLEELRKLLDRGDIQLETRVFSSAHPHSKELREKKTVSDLLKGRWDPAYSLFDILWKARARRDNLRSKEEGSQSSQAQAPSSSPSSPYTPSLDSPEREGQTRFIPLWVWTVSLGLVLSGCGLWLYARYKNGKPLVSDSNPTNTPVQKFNRSVGAVPPRNLMIPKPPVNTYPTPTQTADDRNREKDDRDENPDTRNDRPTEEEPPRDEPTEAIPMVEPNTNSLIETPFIENNEPPPNEPSQ